MQQIDTVGISTVWDGLVECFIGTDRCQGGGGVEGEGEGWGMYCTEVGVFLLFGGRLGLKGHARPDAFLDGEEKGRRREMKRGEAKKRWNGDCRLLLLLRAAQPEVVATLLQSFCSVSLVLRTAEAAS
jgi:hypothetical protein